MPISIIISVTEHKPLLIRDDWSTNYSFIDDPKTKTIKVQIYGTPQVLAKEALPALTYIPPKVADATHLATPGRYARDAQPAVAEAPATQQLTFTLWAGADYDAAQAMNAPNGYGTPDLNSAIAAFLTKQVSTST